MTTTAMTMMVWTISELDVGIDSLMAFAVAGPFDLIIGLLPDSWHLLLLLLLCPS